MSAAPGREIEIKLQLESAEAGRRRLEAAGFRGTGSRTFQADTIYDTGGGALRRAGSLLRLRRSGAAAAALLTYKGPCEPGKHKSREELETTAGDASTLARILGRLGYQPAFRYEKYRTGYAREQEPGTAFVDETPIGCFLELEGPPEWIDGTAAALGFAESDYITASYAALYAAFRAEHPAAPVHMVFPATAA